MEEFQPLLEEYPLEHGQQAEEEKLQVQEWVQEWVLVLVLVLKQAIPLDGRRLIPQ